MKGLCGHSIQRTNSLDLVWRVSVAHSNSWYQITERGYFDDFRKPKESGPLMKESEGILLARRLLEDALSRPWLQRSARKAISALFRASQTKHQSTKK